jgi:hypothetical protein
MITESIIASTAVASAYIAWREFIKTPKQESEKEKGDKYITSKDEIIVFETSSQRTTILMKFEKLECYLFDKKKNSNELQWEINKEQAEQILNNNEISVYPSYRPNTGTFTVGQKKNWLYSKKLFPNPDYLREELKNLLQKIRK